MEVCLYSLHTPYQCNYIRENSHTYHFCSIQPYLYNTNPFLLFYKILPNTKQMCVLALHLFAPALTSDESAPAEPAPVAALPLAAPVSSVSTQV